MLAKQLDERGVRVFATCLTQDGAQILKEETSDLLETLILDVTDEEAVKDAVVFVEEKCDHLYAVVNNAGIHDGLFVEFTPLSVMKKVMDVNLFGTVTVSKYFAPLLRQSKGRFVNIASIAGRFAFSGTVAYTTSKFAVEGFSDCLRLEMSPHGVKVVVIEPTFMNTDMVHNMGGVIRKQIEDADESLLEAYDGQVNDILQALDVSPNFSYDPQVTIDVLLEALEAKFPQSRYRAGNQAKYLLLPLSFLPSGVHELLLRIMSLKK
eukprot:TRINITY_DN1149_c0_g1_i4.p1 TRINITY_DN1149_c0_g1~~TRINITY_DN1149_c0_g1_i4.p1  ORF type:complete len:265 (-),score=63.83 TRINITY_DN1149_c0_g1_i4:386-1180(-)